jgi:TolB protein
MPPISSALLMCASVSLAATVFGQPKPVGEFVDHADIGAPKIGGSAVYDAERQAYTLTAGGTNMWGTRDEFHFAWKKLGGDFIVRARVQFAGPGVDPHRKGGWIARESLEADAAYVDTAAHAGDGLTSLQFRRRKGAITEQIVLPVKFADVLQLERRDGMYIFSAANYGEPFVSVEIADVDLGTEPLVGLFLCSHRADVEERATFSDVRIVRPPKKGWVAYRDYIGSKLEILDVPTGELRVIHESDEPFEAPNPTPDGKGLIYNVSGQGANRGRLRYFDLATRTPRPLDTGFATRNNNDHVLSFDGTMLGISHHAQDSQGRSAIYTLPATGGVPKRITPETPSYLHGWSPDGQWLVYTGGRKEQPGAADKYDIYKIPSDGSGPEVRLTSSPGLSDGPEFSPDGRFIYFNSTRTGLMQLWRMRPDGSEQEQVTNDDFNNWFPHLSPDGKWIAYLAYGQDVKPDDHPYYRHVYLKLMPATGGPAKVIAYVFGGQGTINVPSWSSDSRTIAFVSNTDMK